MFKTKDQTVPASARRAAASPLGGSYVAVFDRPQAAPGTSGGSYTGSSFVSAPGRGTDSYVARFDTEPRTAGIRGTYVDAEY